MLNTTQAERDKQAKADERKKRILELSLFILLQRQFRRYSKQYKQAIVNNGAIAAVIGLQLALQDILKKHYKKVSAEFSTQIVDKLGKPHNHPAVLSHVDMQTEVHSELRSVESSEIIARTTHKEAMTAWEKVRADAEAKGEVLTATKHAARAQLHLDRKLAARTPMISNVETQNPAEHAKMAEVIALDDNDSEIDDVVISERKKDKEWVTMGDSRVRPWHAEADGQTVPFYDPFIVNFENLMYPGDMSLGASFDNVVECRCAMIVTIH